MSENQARQTVRPRRHRRPRWVAAAFVLITLAGCGGSTAAIARPSPSPSAVVNVPLPDFNSRLGSNRLAAEAAAQLGRELYTQGQYWEVYVRTQPSTLPGRYDPAQPQASAAAADSVTQVDIIMATEAGGAIQTFSAGGEAHERAELSSLDAVLRRAFPHVSTDTLRVFFGESFQHGVAVFNGGKLTQYTVRKLG